MPARGYSVTPRTKRNAVPRGPSPAERRLSEQVARQRTKVHQGRGVKVDTGNVRGGSRALTPKEELKDALQSVSQTARRNKLKKVKDDGGGGLRATLERELSGKGAIAGAFSDVADFVGKNAFLVQTGPTVAGNVAKGKRGGSGIATATAPNATKIKNVPGLRRTVEDLINLPAVAIPSLYVPAAGLAEAATGDSKRLKQFAKDFKETDPVYAALTGDFKRAGKLAAEHPGFTAIEVAGLKGAAGRGAGRAVRGAARVTGSEKLKRIGTTERESAVIPGTSLTVRREYSRDLGRKAVQVQRDKRKIRQAAQLRQQARRIEGTDPDRAIDLRKRANRTDPRIASDHALKARENLRESRNENLRSKDVGAVDTRVQGILKQAGDKGAAPVLVASGITRASLKDLVKYHDELKAAHATLTDPGKLAANVRLRAAIQTSVKTAQKTGDTDLRRVLGAAQRYAKEIDQPLDKTLADMGLLEAARGEKAKLIPFAARGMGATLGKPEPPPVAPGGVRAAKAQRARTGRGVTSATRKAAKEEARSTIRVSDADRRLLRSDKDYREAARDVAAAGREYRAAKTAHRNAHRNEGLWSREERIVIEIRAARAERELKAAKGRFAAAKAAAEKKHAKALGTAPPRTLSRLESARADLLARERVHAAAKENVPVVKAQVRAARAARKAPPQLLDADGRPLSAEQVQARAAREREVDPSYVSQAPTARGAGAYYRASAREPTVSSRARTEKPTLEGTFDADPEALRARAMNAQGLATAAKNFRETIAETGLRGKDGKVRTNLTRQEAEAGKRTLEAKHGLEFELVAVRPWAARGAQLKELQDQIDAGGTLDPRAFASFRDGLVEAFEGKGDGPFALLPRATVRQQVQHLKVLAPTDVGKAIRGVRSAFTRTVLTTSPGPTFGNLVEPGVRAAAMRAGPLSTYRAKGVLRELKAMDPEAARKLEATIGRGKVTLASAKRYVDPQQFDQGFLRQTVAGWQAVKRARGINKTVAAWDMWTHFVFDSVNGRAEQFFRQGPMLGKVLKNSGLLDASVLGVSKKAMREAARGLTDTATQALMAKKLNDAYGKYQGFSPAGRKIIAEYTPFAAWMLSSITFIGKVLPRDHPELLTLIAVSAAATEEWRLAQGLDLFMGKGKLPGWLQGSVPAGKMGRAKLAYNTPFGAATDPGAGVASLVFPQGESFLKALEGFDWKDKKLRNKDGSEYDEIQKALYGLGEVVKSTVPAVAVPMKAKRYVDKPATLLNPVRIPPRKGTSTGASAPANAAEEREARAILKQETESAAAKREQAALEREARAILADGVSTQVAR